jgi:hypothetical protein
MRKALIFLATIILIAFLAGACVHKKPKPKPAPPPPKVKKKVPPPPPPPPPPWY